MKPWEQVGVWGFVGVGLGVSVCVGMGVGVGVGVDVGASVCVRICDCVHVCLARTKSGQQAGLNGIRPYFVFARTVFACIVCFLVCMCLWGRACVAG